MIYRIMIMIIEETHRCYKVFYGSGVHQNAHASVKNVSIGVLGSVPLSFLGTCAPP